MNRPFRLRPFSTVDQFADFTGVSRKTITRAIDRGELRVHDFGRTLRIAEQDGLAFTALRRR